MKITMKQIAESAGVHRSTVDKVIHNRPGVSDDVRAKIQAIIDELGYKPDTAGMALNYKNRVFKIAILFLEVDAKSILEKAVQKGLKEYSEFNIETAIYSCKYSDEEAQIGYLNSIAQNHYDGVLISPVFSDRVRDAIRRLVDQGIYVITFNGDIQDSGRMCYVGQDSLKEGRIASRMIGEFLRGKGKVAIVSAAYLDENNDFSVSGREKGFRKHLTENYPDIEIVTQIDNMEDSVTGFTRTMKMLDEYPQLDGIYITCGGVVDVGRALKIQGRTEMNVVAHESYPQIIELMKEGIITCTIANNLEEEGLVPMRMLLDKIIYGKNPKTDQYLVSASTLVKENFE